MKFAMVYTDTSAVVMTESMAKISTISEVDYDVHETFTAARSATVEYIQSSIRALQQDVNDLRKLKKANVHGNIQSPARLKDSA